MAAREDDRASASDTTGAPLRVLMITNMYPSAPNPVFGVFVARQVAALRELGVDVQLVKNTEWRGGWRSLLKYPLLTLRALLASTTEHDVIVGHYLYPTAWIARLIRRGDTPYMVVAHGTDASSSIGRGLLSRASRRGLRDADAVVAVSSAMADRLHNELGLSVGVDVHVIHMGVDTQAFAPDPIARDSMTWATDRRVMLFTGNLLPVKGPDIAVRAFALLHGRGAADRLVIVGDGPMEDELRNLVESLGLTERVTFAGKLDTKSVAARMAAADVLVMSSRNEGLGLVALEAMACGTPVAATRVGGVPEVFPGSQCGILVEPEDPEALADAVEEILGQGKKHYSDACVRSALVHDVRAKAQEFIEVLREVTA
ncbi:MAG: glycosyltransferase [Actinomycetota bacterium]|nr:glycosyltransferase [Actinomycetota bacterium]